MTGLENQFPDCARAGACGSLYLQSQDLSWQEKVGTKLLQFILPSYPGPWSHLGLISCNIQSSTVQGSEFLLQRKKLVPARSWVSTPDSARALGNVKVCLLLMVVSFSSLFPSLFTFQPISCPSSACPHRKLSPREQHSGSLQLEYITCSNKKKKKKIVLTIMFFKMWLLLTASVSPPLCFRLNITQIPARLGAFSPVIWKAQKMVLTSKPGLLTKATWPLRTQASLSSLLHLAKSYFHLSHNVTKG